MGQAANFCTKCGSALVDGAGFCTGCGAPVAPTASDASPAGEHIYGIIPNAAVKGGFLGMGSKPYIMVVTDRRIVFAHVTSQMMKQMVTDARTGAKEEGKGFFGQWGAQMTAYAKFAERYKTMSPDAALAETPENFALERGEIVKAKLRHGTYDEESGSTSTDRLIIKTTSKKHTIDLRSGISQAKPILLDAHLI